MIALQYFINSLGLFLNNQVATPLTSVGPALPIVVAELPAVTISMQELTCGRVGVGGNPSNLVQGSLQVALTLDLSDPVVNFPDETVNLLAEDRRNIQIPHQPLVDTNGSSPEFLGQDDVSVLLEGAPVTVVQEEPENAQCRLTTATGNLEFGMALPVTGELVITYRIGQWEAETTRCTGMLQIDIFASGIADTDLLSNQVSLALSSRPQNIMQGLTRLSPVAWGAIEKAGIPRGHTRLRTLRYSFTFDHEQPVISTGGGPIRTIDVWSAMGPEQFLITKRENHE